ncbi:tetratricopeptide repeat protein [Lysinibacillus sp. NPDC098008]|uniref:tetratricopeptide repeat protein n=1 Tax=Lysinibacillus sp. NPDC098008 TaxID=3364146 RepID=UPI0038024402
MIKNLNLHQIDFLIPANMQNIYDYALAIMQEHEKEAARIFRYLLTQRDVSNVHSGCLISLGRINLNKYSIAIFSNKRDLKKESELAKFALDALKVKPSNTMAHAFLTELYVLIGDFKTAIQYFHEIPTFHGILALEQNFSSQLKFISELIRRGDFSREIYLGEDAKAFYRAFLKQKKHKLSDKSYCAIANCFLDGTTENALFALDIVKLAEIEYGETFSIITMYCNIYSVGLYQFPEKLLYYALKRKEMSQGLEDKFEKEYLELTDSHLGQAYVGVKNYEEAIKVLEGKVNSSPTNTDLHNLANAYYHVKNYDLALQNGIRALYTQEDETTLHLVARVYHEQKNHKEAIKYFERELHFRKNEEKVIKTQDENGQIILSRLSDEDEEMGYEKLYLLFLSSLYQEKEYIKAKVILEEALADYPDNLNIKLWESILDNALSQEQLINSYEELLDEERKKHFSARENLENTRHKYHAWAEQLLSIQSKEFNEITLDKDMEIIIEALKDESGLSSQKLKEVKKKIAEYFPYLEYKSQVFLATADYLYSSNRYGIMDFAPIVVEYSKVLEYELNARLKFKKKQTLGQLIHYIRENKVPHFIEYLSDINQILLWRNGSAHTSTSTIEVVESIRDKYYSEGLLENLFKHGKRRRKKKKK